MGLGGIDSIKVVLFLSATNPPETTPSPLRCSAQRRARTSDEHHSPVRRRVLSSRSPRTAPCTHTRLRRVSEAQPRAKTQQQHRSTRRHDPTQDDPTQHRATRGETYSTRLSRSFVVVVVALVPGLAIANTSR